jgi:tetratricopeptide (TPR) repeat protein
MATELLYTGDMPAELTPKIQELQAAFQAGQTLKAQGLAKALEPKALSSSDLSDLLAGFYYRLGVLEGALRLSRQAVTLNPKSATALLHLGQLEQDLGYSQPAGEHLRAARDLAPNAVQVHLALARFLERELHQREGEAERREALSLEPQNPGIMGELASNLIRQQRYGEARALLVEADRFAPNAPPGLLQRAQIAWEEARRGIGNTQERYSEMETWLTKCLQASPDDPGALFLLGNLRVARGDDAGAEQALSTALARAPELEGLRVQLGQVLVRRGQKERGEAMINVHRKLQEHREMRDRLVSRVAMQPENTARRQELIRWCLANGELARATLEQAELKRQLGSRTGK